MSWRGVDTGWFFGVDLFGFGAKELEGQFQEYKRTGRFTCSACVMDETPGYVEKRIELFDQLLEEPQK